MKTEYEIKKLINENLKEIEHLNKYPHMDNFKLKRYMLEDEIRALKWVLGE